MSAVFKVSELMRQWTTIDKRLAIATGILLVAACVDSDAPPRGAVEGEIAVTATMGGFDPEKSMTIAPTIYVLIDEEEYILQLSKKAKVVDKSDVGALFLGGRKVLVKGKIKDDEYHASYLKWLPDDGEGKTPEVTLGIPVD